MLRHWDVDLLRHWDRLLLRERHFDIDRDLLGDATLYPPRADHTERVSGQGSNLAREQDAGPRDG